MKDVGNTVVWTLRHGKTHKSQKKHIDCRQNKSPVEKRIQNIISGATWCCFLTSFIFNYFFILSGKYFNQLENLNTISYYAKKSILDWPFFSNFFNQKSGWSTCFFQDLPTSRHWSCDLWSKWPNILEVMWENPGLLIRVLQFIGQAFSTIIRF